jgi:long-chain acyl-CoA synthetase
MPEKTCDSRTGLELFTATVARDPKAVLAHYFDRPVTAGQLRWMSDALAVALQRRGVARGDRIALYMQNVPQALIAILAAWKCGAIVVPCNPMLRERELGKILSDAGCRVLLCQDDLFAESGRAAVSATAVEHVIATSALDFLSPGAAVPRALAGVTRYPHADAADMRDLIAQHMDERPEAIQLGADDVAFLIYTSGTTGEPKAAMNTHANVVFSTSVYARWIGLTQADTILGLAPLSHVTGLIGHVTLAMLTGSPLVLFYRFDADEACRLIEAHGATFTVSSVTAFIALLGCEGMRTRDLRSLTKVYTGGAPTPARVLAEWYERTGKRLHPMYGLTEATSPTHMTPYGLTPPVDPLTGIVSIGVPVFDTKARVVTEQGRTAHPLEIGEVVIAGPQIVPGYWQRASEAGAALRGGELRTGDVGFMDEKGWFYLVGRTKDMIVASGFKVWPREVEDVLYEHPAVREAAVVGVPDRYRGETIKAIVSLKPGLAATAEDIRTFVQRLLAAYKVPRLVEIVDELPKTASGKILRRLLAAAAESTAATTTGRQRSVA